MAKVSSWVRIPFRISIQICRYEKQGRVLSLPEVVMIITRGCLRFTVALWMFSKTSLFFHTWYSSITAPDGLIPSILSESLPSISIFELETGMFMFFVRILVRFLSAGL
jgi:hypothetical protein